MDDGRFAGPSDCAVRISLGGLLGLDARRRRPPDRARAGRRPGTCAESVRDHRPQPVGNQRDHPRHSGRRYQVPRGSVAPAAEAARRFAAADEIGMDFRRPGPRAGQQPGDACSRRHRLFGSGLFQGSRRPGYRNFHRRCADAARALSRGDVLWRQPSAAKRRWQLRRRDPGLGTAEIFREFLCPDRPRSRQLLRARPRRRHSAGPFSGSRARHPYRSQPPGWTKDRRQPEAGLVTVTSPADGIERRLGYQRLAEYPVYVAAGLETSAIRSRWLATMGQHLIFGLPATALLFLILALALRRTRRLYAEASRRLEAEEALKHGQRLVALGQPTGGVAHNFTNPLPM